MSCRFARKASADAVLSGALAQASVAVGVAQNVAAKVQQSRAAFTKKRKKRKNRKLRSNRARAPPFGDHRIVTGVVCARDERWNE